MWKIKINLTRTKIHCRMTYIFTWISIPTGQNIWRSTFLWRCRDPKFSLKIVTLPHFLTVSPISSTFNEAEGQIVLYNAIKNTVSSWSRATILKTFGSETKLRTSIDKNGKDTMSEAFKKWMTSVIWHMLWSCCVWPNKIWQTSLIMKLQHIPKRFTKGCHNFPHKLNFNCLIIGIKKNFQKKNTKIHGLAQKEINNLLTDFANACYKSHFLRQ